MQQHEINTEVNKLLQKLTKCVEQLGSTGTQQIEINGLLKDELVKVINKAVDLDQRVALLEARNQITDKVSEIIDVRPN